MANIIGLHLGTAGARVGNSFWQAMIKQQNVINQSKHTEERQKDYNKVFFEQTQKKANRPHAVFIDFDVRTQQFLWRRQTYNNNSILTTFQQADSLFRPPQKLNQLQHIAEIIRKEAESCDKLGGVIFTCAPGEAAGSSLQSAALNIINDYYYGVIVQDFLILPSSRQNQGIEPHSIQCLNTILNNSYRQSYADLIYVFDNPSAIRQAQKISKADKNKEKISYSAITALMGIYLTEYTAAYRYQGQLNVGQRKRAMNIKPFPRLPYAWFNLSQMACEDYVSSSLHFQNSLYNNDQQIFQQIYTMSCSVRDPLMTEMQVWQKVCKKINPTAMTNHSSWFSCNLGNVNLINKKSTLDRSSIVQDFRGKEKPFEAYGSACTIFNGKLSIAWLKNYSELYEMLLRRKAFMHYYMQRYDFVEADFHQATGQVKNISCFYGQFNEQADHGQNV